MANRMFPPRDLQRGLATSALGAAWLGRERLVERALLLLGALGVTAYLLAGIHQSINAYDEGFAVYGAARVLAGDMPHRDFWTVYPPGQFYVLAGLFQVFGTTVMVERLWDTAARLAIVLAVYGIGTALGSRRAALGASAVVMLLLAAVDYYGYAVWPAVALTLGAVWCALRYYAAPRSGWLVASGTAVGAATLFRHDLGAYALASLGLAHLLALTLREPPWQRPRAWWAAALRTGGLLALGVAAALVPAVLWLLWTVPADTLWADLVVYPLTLNRHISYLATPPLIPTYLPVLSSAVGRAEYLRDVIVPWTWFYEPLLVYAAGAAAALTGLVRRDPARPATQPLGLLLLVLLGLALFHHAMVRFDRMHALPTTIVAALVLAILLARHLPRRGRLPLAVVTAPLVLAGVFAFVVVPVQRYAATLALFPPLVCQAALPRAGCVDLYPDQEQALAYVRAHTRPGEHIFVGNTRHDRTFGSNVIFYFLAERPSATRYHELVSGVTTTLPVQREIVADLERHDVRLVVLSAVYDHVDEPNMARFSRGVTLLDDYVRNRYQAVARFNMFTVWERHD